MTKHPLLPKDYTDSITHANIIYALNIYANEGSEGVANPRLKWDLHSAWEDAQELLAKSHWRYNTGEDLDKNYADYVLAAYTEDEIEDLNKIIAGIVGHQILEPDTQIAFRRIEHKKGGEMSLIISNSVAEVLNKRFPSLTSKGEGQAGSNTLKAIKDTLCKIFHWKKNKNTG